MELKVDIIEVAAVPMSVVLVLMTSTRDATTVCIEELGMEALAVIEELTVFSILTTAELTALSQL